MNWISRRVGGGLQGEFKRRYGWTCQRESEQKRRWKAGDVNKFRQRNLHLFHLPRSLTEWPQLSFKYDSISTHDWNGFRLKSPMSHGFCPKAVLSVCNWPVHNSSFTCSSFDNTLIILIIDSLLNFIVFLWWMFS